MGFPSPRIPEGQYTTDSSNDKSCCYIVAFDSFPPPQTTTTNPRPPNHSLTRISRMDPFLATTVPGPAGDHRPGAGVVGPAHPLQLPGAGAQADHGDQPHLHLRQHQRAVLPVRDAGRGRGCHRLMTVAFWLAPFIILSYTRSLFAVFGEAFRGWVGVDVCTDGCRLYFGRICVLCMYEVSALAPPGPTGIHAPTPLELFEGNRLDN